MISLRIESGIRKWLTKGIDLGGFSKGEEQGKDKISGAILAMLGSVRALFL